MNHNLINTKIIESYRKENNLSIAKFCRTCGISTSTYKRIIANKNFKLNALFKIAKIIKVPVCQIFS